MGFIHLIFTIIRIGILSIIYGFIIWVLLSKIFKLFKVKRRYLIPVIFICLTLWRFSYWRNNGFADFGRVPLTSKYHIEMIDFASASIYIDGDELNTNWFEMVYEEDDILYAQTGKEFLILNLESDTLIDNLTLEDFIAYNGDVNKLISLSQFHSDHWGLKILFY